jgi:hypothetical protein
MANPDSSLDAHMPKDLDGVVWLLAYVVAGVAEIAGRGNVDPGLAQGLEAASAILSKTATAQGHPEVARRFAAASDRLRQSSNQAG